MSRRARKVCRGEGWGVTVNVHMCYRRVAHVEPCRARDTRRPQMGRGSAVLSRATPSVHMLKPSCYLSVCVSVCVSVCRLYMARMLDGAPSGPHHPSQCWKSGPVWEPHWHIRGCVCLIGLKPSALNPKQNEQAARWLLCHPLGPHVINTSNAAVMGGGRELVVDQKQSAQSSTSSCLLFTLKHLSDNLHTHLLCQYHVLMCG